MIYLKDISKLNIKPLKMNVKQLTIVLIALFSFQANAQQDEQMSLYMYNKLYLILPMRGPETQ